MILMNLQNRNRLRDLEYELMVAVGGSGGGLEEGIVGEFGVDVYAVLYLKWIANKDLL